MRSRLLPTLVLLAVVATACGSDDDSGGSDAVSEVAPEESSTAVADAAAEPAEDADGQSNGDATAESGGDTGTGDSGDAPAPGGGGRTATLTLDNGEIYEFSVLCSLEPQMAAGSEILFTAVSYDDPGLDITQFGDEGTVTGIANVSVYDGDYETLWEANTFFEAFGGGLELTLDGSTIRGSGTFFPDADPAAGEGVPGEIVANC